MTCQAPDEQFICWVDGTMTFTSKIRQEAYIAIKTSVDPKTEIKVGR